MLGGFGVSVSDDDPGGALVVIGRFAIVDVDGTPFVVWNEQWIQRTAAGPTMEKHLKREDFKWQIY